MANEKHLELAREGREVWNKWWAENPVEPLDFSGTDFTKDENEEISFAGFTFHDYVNFAGSSFGAGLAELRHGANEKGDRISSPKGSAIFAGARFMGDAIFSSASLGHSAKFDAAKFEGVAVFSEANFGHSCSFDKAEFYSVAAFPIAEFGNDASFEGVVFGKGALFKGAIFGEKARFAGTDSSVFGDKARFDGVSFGDFANFERVVFGNEAEFICADFGYQPNFFRSSFGSSCKFLGARFGDQAQFSNAVFGKLTSFKGAIFSDQVNFIAAVFGDRVSFSAGSENELDELLGEILEILPEPRRTEDKRKWATREKQRTELATIDFSHAHFQGSSTFSGRSIKSLANFADVQFEQPPDLYEFDKPDRMDLTGAVFGFGDKRRKYWTTSSDIATRLRRLRKLAADIHASDAERDLFILERLAQRGILWKSLKSKEYLNYTQGLLQATGHCVLMFLYRWSSDYGRSVGAPVGWLLGLNFLFHLIYAAIFSASVWSAALWKFTFSTFFPFGALAREARTQALAALGFSEKLPWGSIAVSVIQGLVNVVLLFLIGLALRNFFKTK